MNPTHNGSVCGIYAIPQPLSNAYFVHNILLCNFDNDFDCIQFFKWALHRTQEAMVLLEPYRTFGTNVNLVYNVPN